MDLTSLLDLERIDEDRWLGPVDPVDLPQLYGGLLVAQSLVAGGLSCDPRARVHSSHTTFLSAGTAGEPVEYRVEELLTGRRRSTRDVGAWQHGRLLTRTLVSAAAPGEELPYSPAAPADPSALAPAGRVEDAVPMAVIAEESGGLGPWWSQFHAVEARLATPDGPGGPDGPSGPDGQGDVRLWMRTSERLPDDPLVHRAALAYTSDLLLISTAAVVHGVPFGHETTLAAAWWGISLDHTMWFADDLRADDWLLHEQVSPVGHDGRVLVQSGVRDLAGRRVCGLAQEALLRRQR